MKQSFLIFLLSSFLFLSCQKQYSQSVTTISPEAFAEKIESTQNAQILDVRTPEEFSAEHLLNAKNIDWLGTQFEADAKKLDKTKPVFVYCKSGGRSKKACSKLNELGFTTIYEMDGGFLKWSATGLNVPSVKSTGMSSEEYKILLDNDKKILINFYLESCDLCKDMDPYLSSLKSELASKVVIISINADENKTLISQLNLEILPTLILYKNGVIKWRHSGFINEKDLRTQLQK